MMRTPTSPPVIRRKHADLRWMAEELVKAWKRIEEQDALIASIRSFMAEKGDGGGG
jgi:hypothetical protein